jgi:hypothetical protein
MQRLTETQGEMIGYAPIYAAPPPLAQDTPTTTEANPGGVGALERRAWVLAFVVAGASCLATWGVFEKLYSGADIRALQREAQRSEQAAIAAEQRAADAIAAAEQWQAHAGAQAETIGNVRGLVCD